MKGKSEDVNDEMKENNLFLIKGQSLFNNISSKRHTKESRRLFSSITGTNERMKQFLATADDSIIRLYQKCDSKPFI